MPEILMMRHAKSEHPDGVSDRERPLSARGRRSALAIGRAISRFGATPDVVLTSPARRAVDTATLACTGGDWDVSVEIVEALYGDGVASVLGSLAGRGEARVLAVGHEPTWSMTVSTVIGGGSIEMVTGAVACLAVATAPASGSGRLRWMLQPRLLTESQ